MINVAFLLLQQLADRGGTVAGPDELDVAHMIVMTHRWIDSLMSIEASGALAIALGAEI